MFATRYDGPTIESTLGYAGTTVRVVRPAEPDRLLDDPAVDAMSRSDDYMPYWAYLWPGAHLLAEAIAREPGLAGRACLEIGCGLGLGGLVAAAGGAVVTFTDYDSAPLAFVAASLDSNGLTGSTATLDWREPPADRYPLILGADVLYERRLVPLVVGLLATMLDDDGVALLAGPYRVASEDFVDRARLSGLSVEVVEASARDEAGRPVRGRVWRVRRG